MNAVNSHISIITPCSRVGNLTAIYNSIKKQPRKFMTFTWIIVYDATHGKFPGSLVKKLLYFHSLPNVVLTPHVDADSVFGNAQRNRGLELVKDGWVYFLDDDTVLHPDFFKVLEKLITVNPEVGGFIFSQVNEDGTERLNADTVEINKVDTGQLVVKRNLIGNTIWRKGDYNADGFFITEIYNNNLANIQKCPEVVLSVYNKLR